MVKQRFSQISHAVLTFLLIDKNSLQTTIFTIYHHLIIVHKYVYRLTCRIIYDKLQKFISSFAQTAKFKILPLRCILRIDIIANMFVEKPIFTNITQSQDDC